MRPKTLTDFNLFLLENIVKYTILLLPLILLSGCYNTVSNDEINSSIEFCKTNDGLQYILTHTNANPKAHCNNGGEKSISTTKR